MEKTLRITHDIKVVPVDEETVAIGNMGLPEAAHMTQEDVMNECEAFELAEIVQGMFHDDVTKEAFAGSEIWVTFEGHPIIVGAEFL
jgi:hypothetical protein